MPIFYLIEFRLAKGKKKGTTGVPSRFWGQKFLKTGLAAMANRNMKLAVTIQDGTIWVSDDRTNVQVDPIWMKRENQKPWL